MGGEAQRFSNYRMLSTSDLKLGDILIVKDFGGPIESGLDSFVVRSAQAVFSHVRGGSFYSEHCILFARDTSAGDAPNSEIVVEAVDTGVTRATAIFPRQHLVYRFCGGSKQVRDLMRFRAVDAAMAFAGRNRSGKRVPFAAYKVGKVPLPAPKAVASFFRSQKRGSFANQHLRVLYDAVFGSAALPKVRMICSELVATCYELAALYLWHQNLYPYESCLNIDPRATTAKALESALNNRPHLFKIVGRYQGQNGVVVSGPLPPAGQGATAPGVPGG